MAGINNKQLLIMRPEANGFGNSGEPSGYAKLEERGNKILVQFGAQDLRQSAKGEYACMLYFSGNDKTFLLGTLTFDDNGNGFAQEYIDMRDVIPSSVMAAGIMYIENGFLYPALCGHKGGGAAWLSELITGACNKCGTKRGGEYTSWEYHAPTEKDLQESEEFDLQRFAARATASTPPVEKQEVAEEPIEETVFGSTQEQLENDFSESKDAQTYYDCNAESFERLLKENEPVEGLNDLIPGSEWVRVEYNDQDQQGHYILGIIYDDNHKPIYICYGIPSKYTPQPPENIKGYCQWIPEKSGQPQESGYWMLYQNASTGERYEE